MGKKAEQIAALEAECSALVKERDGYRRALADAHREVERLRRAAETPGLAERARGELERRWGWLLDLVGA